MERTVLNHVLAEANNVPSNSFTLTPVTAANGAEVVWDERDDRMTLLFHNTGSSPVTVTVHKGDGIAAVVDLEVTVAASSFAHLHLDSARFKCLSGENRGKVLLSTSGAVSMAALVIG